MLRRAPISPLFPYTTLFRSRSRAGVRRRRAPPRRRGRDASGRVRAARARSDGEGSERRRRGARQRRVRPGDRKSTRLNSSHANISYAVFCLKKKKKKKTQV